MAKTRKTVFVSYAHKDRKWADELVTFLAPWIRDKRVDLWDDSRIQMGDNWRTEIRKAIEEATVAVLLVTKDFLASDFITKHELPILLKRALKKEVSLAWVAVGHSGVEATDLWHFQAVNDPAHPLETLDRAHRNKVMVGIAKGIADAVTIGTFAGGLQIIDETVEPLEAALEGRPEQWDRVFHVQANYEPAQNRISFSGANQTITDMDLKGLPEDDREFIADLEDSLSRNYKRWSAVRKGLGEAGGALDGEVETQLTRIAKLMCRDLNSILDFLRKMHKAELEDHYGRYRFICERLNAT
jgi:TIR domain-containing protein